MGKRFTLLILAALLVLLCCGCDSAAASPEATVPTQTTEATVPVTVPADGNPDDVTCQGSYSSGSFDPEAVVSELGSHSLTNGQLQVWYWLEAAAWQQGEQEAYPDYSRPLDTQPCEVDDSVNSWQQFFLKRALNTWHSVYAMELQAQEQPLPTEEAYQPNLENYETYMTGMPATEVLYGYDPLYSPNSMHEEYLTALPETLEALAKQKGYAGLEDLAATAFGTSAEVLTEAVRLYNFSYMYFTTLGYYVECPEEEVFTYMDTVGGYDLEGCTVDIRHILLIPEGTEEDPVTVAEDGTVTCSEAAWEAGMKEAEELLKYWRYKTKHTGPTFSELAVKNSDDAGSALNGGIYRNIRQGQLMQELDAWCFDAARQSGDIEIFRSRYGYHILYFTGSKTAAVAQAEEDLTVVKLQEIIDEALDQHYAKIAYSAITLTQGEAVVSASEILYPDIAHERFPEVPLYLQQDYPDTMFGAYKIRSHGCGITTMAMLASYMADDELTPPEMCDRYGSYSHRSGTDGMIFIYEPAVMGFYLREKTYDPRVAYAALEEGQIVISVQHKGYWTRGGHYIVLEKLREDGQIQVRDSNIYNYSRVKSHVEDRHTWGSITNNGSGFWIFEDKITRIPACSRCGTPEELATGLLEDTYICEKCIPALLRRSTFLSTCTLDNK